jgi:hypothetical protein
VTCQGLDTLAEMPRDKTLGEMPREKVLVRWQEQETLGEMPRARDPW